MCLMVTADHGPAVSGAHNTIVTARAGKDLISSLCSGLLTIVSGKKNILLCRDQAAKLVFEFFSFFFFFFRGQHLTFVGTSMSLKIRIFPRTLGSSRPSLRAVSSEIWATAEADLFMTPYFKLITVMLEVFFALDEALCLWCSFITQVLWFWNICNYWMKESALSKFFQELKIRWNLVEI